MAKKPTRDVLGSNPLDAYLSPSTSAAVKSAAPKSPRSGRQPKRERPQLNALFDSWELIDWVKAAAWYKRCDQRDIIREALTQYRDALPLAQRRDISAQVLKYDAQRRGRKG